MKFLKQLSWELWVPGFPERYSLSLGMLYKKRETTARTYTITRADVAGVCHVHRPLVTKAPVDTDLTPFCTPEELAKTTFVILHEKYSFGNSYVYELELFRELREEESTHPKTATFEKKKITTGNLTKEEVMCRAQQVRQVVWTGHTDGYLAKVPEKLFSIAYTWEPEKRKEQAIKRTEAKPAVWDEITLHTCNYPLFFRPSVAEVVSQMPASMFDDPSKRWVITTQPVSHDVNQMTIAWDLHIAFSTVYEDVWIQKKLPKKIPQKKKRSRSAPSRRSARLQEKAKKFRRVKCAKKV